MDSIKQILFNFGEKLRNQIIANSNAAGQTVTKKTQQSMITEASDNEVSLSAANYFPVLEKGRKDGKRPPIQAIQAWIDARNLGDKLNAWAVAKSIEKKGTKLYQNKGRQDIISNVITDEAINELTEEVTSHFANLITTEIKQQYKF